MAVHDGMNIGPRLVDLAVDESLEETRPAVGVAGIAVQVVLDDVIGRYQGGGDRARHQVTLGRLGMAHRDVAEGVDDALGDEDAARRGEVRDLLGGDRAARCGCVAAHVFSAPSFKRSLGSSCPNMAFLRECAIAMIAESPERAGPRFRGFPGFPRSTQFQGRRSTIFTGSLAVRSTITAANVRRIRRGRKPSSESFLPSSRGRRSIDATAPGLSFFSSSNGIDFRTMTSRTTSRSA